MPVGSSATAGGPPDGAALAALPIVGATLGALAGTVGLCAAKVVPAPLGAALALGTVVVLSGAVHLDGFFDGCDAFFASVPSSRRLEILKDPRHGTFALAGLAVAGSIWFAALGALPPRALPASLAFAGALSRAAVLPCAYVFPDARSASREPAFDARNATALLALDGFVIGRLCRRLPRCAALTIPVAPLCAATILRWCAGRLGGGLVGDAYGFAIVVLEAAIAAALAVRA